MLSALCRNGGATTCEVTWQQDAICRGHVVTSAQLRTQHRRRMGTEEKAKVVASVWGTEFVQFLATLAVLPRSMWKNRMNSTFSFNIDQGKTASAARN